MKNIKIIFCSFILMLLSVQSIMSMNNLLRIKNALSLAVSPYKLERTQLLLLCSNRNYDAAKQMLESLPSRKVTEVVNFVDKICWSPLRSVVAENDLNINLEMVKYLVARGAYVNLHLEGYTALNEAIGRHHVPIVELLLKQDADHTIPIITGLSPLAYALNCRKCILEKGRNSDEIEQIIALLKQYGAQE